MPPSHFRLTPAVEQTIVAYIRGGGFPNVAAEAAGIPAAVFARWMRRGERRRAPEQFRAFALAVRQAVAQARLGAEVAVRDDKPLDWLRSGPGKETTNRIGWTGPVRPRPTPAAGTSALLDGTVQSLITDVLRILEPHPEVRAEVAGALGPAASTK
jgi:hypothetical protein